MINRRRHMRLIDCDSDAKEPGSIVINVAFATDDLNRVNQHFGLADGFAIYEINGKESVLVEGAQFDPQKPYEPGHSDDKLMDKIALIEGCVAVYCNAVGPRAVKRLLQSNIQPVKVDEGVMISGLIKELQVAIHNEELPAWLIRALNTKDRQQDDSESRFSDMFDQQWDESGSGV